MQSVKTKGPEKWHVRGRWAIVLVVIGALIIAFVIATNGEQGAWMLWIALPSLMIGLGYLFLVNAIPVFFAPFEDQPSEKEPREKPGDK